MKYACVAIESKRKGFGLMKIFISHASEDKDVIARPLAQKLQAMGLEVWFDEYELTLGDRIRSSIEQGLLECDYAVVVLSKAYISSDWAQKELDGIMAQESLNSKVVLPIRHQLTIKEVLSFSPIIADRVIVSTEKGVEAISDAIVKTIDIKIGPQPDSDDVNITDYLNLNSDLLSVERQVEIVNAYRDIIDGGKLRKHRNDHIRNIKKNKKTVDIDYRKPAWVTLATAGDYERPLIERKDILLNRLIIGFSEQRV